VWPLPFWWMWSTAAAMSCTTSSVKSMLLYSWRAEGAAGRLQVGCTCCSRCPACT
jgi:hypothetical protein